MTLCRCWALACCLLNRALAYCLHIGVFEHHSSSVSLQRVISAPTYRDGADVFVRRSQVAKRTSGLVDRTGHFLDAHCGQPLAPVTMAAHIAQSNAVAPHERLPAGRWARAGLQECISPGADGQRMMGERWRVMAPEGTLSALAWQVAQVTISVANGPKKHGSTSRSAW